MKKIYLQLVLAVFLTPAIYAQTFSGGDGSSGNPYLISNTADLIELSDICATSSTAAGAYYKQTTDIVFNDDETLVDWDGDGTADWDAEDQLGFLPIGSKTGTTQFYFYGHYDGQGYTISNVYIDRPSVDYIGLFGYIHYAATVQNLGVINVTISGKGNVGGFVGYIRGGSSIINCHVTGSVQSDNNYCGGFAGYAGEANTSISKCYSNTNVSSGSLYIGGFIGVAFGADNISNCYSMGDITRTSGVSLFFAGFAGYNSNTISNCYTTSTVYSSAGTIWGDGDGLTADKGFISQNVGTTTNNFFDTEVTGQTSGTGATAKTTAEMTTESTFTGAGWDFTSTWAIDASRNDGYPYLDWQSFPPTDITWDGSESTDWNTADNWDLGTVPTFDHNVIIPVTSNDPVVGSSGSASCTNLTINENATLTVNAGGTLITNGTITNNGTVNIKQSLTEDGHWHFISIPNNTTTANTFLHMYLQQWNEGTTGWEDITDPETNLIPVKGYSLWVPGGTKMDFTYTGTPNTGDQSIAITAAGSGESAGMNLVGNPYPSYLDWDQVSGYGSKYTWNGTAYLSYNQTGSYGEGSQYVAPMEGFFIYTASPTDFDLNNSLRSHLPVAKKDGKARLNNGLVLSASNGNYSDKLWIVIDDNANESFELERDAWKLLSGTDGISQLWSVCPDGNLSIDARPETETIQLGFSNNQAGIYSINLNEIADIPEAWLEDTKTGTFHDLTKSDYEFAWDTTDDETRFKMHLNAVGIEETPFGDCNILIYTANNQIFIKGMEKGEVIVSDIMGRVILQDELSAEGSIRLPGNLKTGVYMVTIQNGKEIKSEKVFIK